MEMMMRNSIQIYTKLKSKGFTEEQAQVLVESMEEHSEVNLKDLATKADLVELKAELKGTIMKLERDIDWLTRLFMSGMLVIIIGLALNFLHH